MNEHEFELAASGDLTKLHFAEHVQIFPFFWPIEENLLLFIALSLYHRHRFLSVFTYHKISKKVCT